jgi:hypothetical protein
MPLETADDLDTFFDPEEFGVAAVYTAPGGAPFDLVAIRDEDDARVQGRQGGRFVMATNFFLLRADKVSPVDKARLDLFDEDGQVTESFVLQGAAVRSDISAALWRCAAVPT